MALAKLSIDLEARIADFERNIRRAADVTQNQAKLMTNALGIASTAMGTLAAGATLGALISFASRTNAATDALNDLSDATGSSVENISALESVALNTGTNIDTVAGALVKFNQVLGDAKPGSAAEQSLRALGLSVQALRALDPAEALRQTAVALSQFADNGDKARLVQDLFGKSVREVAPFLKDLAAAGQLVATTTTEQAAEAEKFSKELARLQAQIDLTNRALLGDLVVGLNALIDKFKEGQSAGEGFFVTLLRQTELARLLGLSRPSDEYVRLRQNIELANSQLKSVNLTDEQRNRILERRLQLEQQLQAGLGKLLTGKRLDALSDPRSLGLPALDLPVVVDKPTKKTARTEVDEERRRALEIGVLRNRLAEQTARDAEALAERLQRVADQTARHEFEVALKAAQDRQALRTKEYGEVLEWMRETTDEQAAKLKANAEKIGEAFGSAFERAIVDGEKLSDVLKGLASDIARMVIRKTISEPIANSIAGSLQQPGGIVGGIFGELLGPLLGRREFGGPVQAGQAYLVGERRAELFVPGASGRIVPSVPAGSATVVQHFNFNGPADYAQVVTAARLGAQMARSQNRDDLARGRLS